MASTQIIRVTMFKFAKKEDPQSMLENMREMIKTAVKVYMKLPIIFSFYQGLSGFNVFSLDAPRVDIDFLSY